MDGINRLAVNLHNTGRAGGVGLGVGVKDFNSFTSNFNKLKEFYGILALCGLRNLDENKTEQNHVCLYLL